MKTMIMTVIVMGLAAGAYAAEMCAGSPVCISNGPLGGEMPHGQYAPRFDDLAAHASDLKPRDAVQEADIKPVPATAEDEAGLRLRAEASADPDKFIDEHTTEEVGMAFGLRPSRCQVTSHARIENAAVLLTVDLTRQRLVVKSPGFNTEFMISSGLLPDNGTPGSGKCFAPDALEAMHYSSQFNNAPMPNTVFFNGSVALHGTSPMNELMLGRPVSHGCVRLSRVNAKTVFDLVNKTGKSKVIICVTGAAPR